MCHPEPPNVSESFFSSFYVRFSKFYFIEQGATSFLRCNWGILTIFCNMQRETRRLPVLTNSLPFVSINYAPFIHKICFLKYNLLFFLNNTGPSRTKEHQSKVLADVSIIIEETGASDIFVLLLSLRGAAAFRIVIYCPLFCNCRGTVLSVNGFERITRMIIM